MKLEVHGDADAVARAAAGIIASEARAAVAARGRFVMAVSGGRTPWAMLRALTAEEDIPWAAVHVAQVDERIAPAGHPDRNLTHLCEALRKAPLGAGQIAAMPVDAAHLAGAALRYERTLETLAGSPPVFDLVHLGLGIDGHTASLVPGDPVLEIEHTDVAVTGFHQGWRRMTLTYPILDRARSVLWMVIGSEKADILPRLRDGDLSIPAARVRRDHALLLADRMAAGEPGPRY